MTAAQTDQNRLLLTEVEQQLANGLAAKAERQIRAAVQHFHRAEQALLKLALHTGSPQLKTQRIAQAERIRQLMTELESASKETRQAEKTIATQPQEGKTFEPVAMTETISFKDVAGLESVKREIRLRMILPFQHQCTAEQFGISNGGGLLLYGPPGTGKTLIAKATAGELNAPFFSIKASDIVAKWFGESEQNIKNLFAATRQHKRAVLFIDEIDALIPARSKSNSSVMARIVPQFLTELDGFQKSNQALLFIGATNEPQSLDPALLRPGRIDSQIYIGLPDLAGRIYLLECQLANKPIDTMLDITELAQAADGLSGADIVNVCNRAARDGFEASLDKPIQPLTQQQLLTLIEHTPRSVSPKQMQFYEQFSQQQGQ